MYIFVYIYMQASLYVYIYMFIPVVCSYDFIYVYIIQDVYIWWLKTETCLLLKHRVTIQQTSLAMTTMSTVVDKSQTHEAGLYWLHDKCIYTQACICLSSYCLARIYIYTYLYGAIYLPMQGTCIYIWRERESGFITIISGADGCYMHCYKHLCE